ncbi:MAG: DNA polymerase III subunit epsilon, partial [Roseococcus sp.]
TDVETDGPDPGVHSMLSLASVACDATGRRLSHFAVNLQALPGHKADSGTLAWWQSQPAAWSALQEQTVPAQRGIDGFVAWVRQFGLVPVFVGNPLIFDGSWVDWYLRRFAGIRLLRAPRTEAHLFEGGGLDLPSFVMGRTGLSYRQCTAKQYPEAWFGGHPHSHLALDDAEGYAHLLGRMLRGER